MESVDVNGVTLHYEAAGENDLILRSETERIADLIPKSTMIILEGEDHGSYIIDSEIMGKLLIDFLNTVWL